MNSRESGIRPGAHLARSARREAGMHADDTARRKNRVRDATCGDDKDESGFVVDACSIDSPPTHLNQRSADRNTY
ncbi:hypothetical protein [Burkholderia gladioli]|uniref:hypothetical protein n=2 Tax=Burkholderia gladioli TaxID=28095 RepID=UPI0010572926|nr:hypothetical protein [Burkholderia gladioli]MBU9167297.1 hypothetical protein [Burkholderia gladioli]